jgi:hypothetical protein
VKRPGRPKAGEEGRDTRAALKPGEARDALAAAAAALPMELLRESRLVLPQEWADVRRAIALLRDDARRACLLELLRDEGARIEAER